MKPDNDPAAATATEVYSRAPIAFGHCGDAAPTHDGADASGVGQPRRLVSNHAYTGHLRLNDGSLVRLDYELGNYAGRYYSADMTVRSLVKGEYEAVAAVVTEWVGEVAISPWRTAA